MISKSGSIKYKVALWLIAAGMIILDAAYYFYSVRAADEKVSSLENEYQTRRASLNKEIREADAANAGHGISLPKWEDFTRVMGEVYKKAERLDLALASVSYQPLSMKESSIVKIAVTMPVKGSYSDIKRFIYELETSPKYFIIDSLSLAGDKGEGESISLNLSVTAHFKG